MRLPNHIGIIPDGNRRFATSLGLTKDAGYSHGILPGVALFKQCEKLGVKELTFYGFTLDNTKRPTSQKTAFIRACIRSVKLISKENAEILVVGNTESKNFPKELIPYTTRKICNNGGLKVNFLINYGWEWDLKNTADLRSKDISRMDLIIRWGGRRRLSGFLPVQSVYSDFYIIDDYWPKFKENHLIQALNWYDSQDVTLGG
ncbi:undecaprenyl diphosphate synthase family protein [uncultured Clostridium sp.]|uniref:undecaprenyl diphosphate synthase family protein n=1 Tax=uncultured Clostridium sp. TaxID=59620 RepID=UPI00260C4A79|nr:undecaprenyl diphosphate synthase family protein [uncultured Clostridium sp.]